MSIGNFKKFKKFVQGRNQSLLQPDFCPDGALERV